MSPQPEQSKSWQEKFGEAVEGAKDAFEEFSEPLIDEAQKRLSEVPGAIAEFKENVDQFIEDFEFPNPEEMIHQWLEDRQNEHCGTHNVDTCRQMDELEKN